MLRPYSVVYFFGRVNIVMNNITREDRRKLDERRESNREFLDSDNLTRPHRMCERECIDLKERIKALESLLAKVYVVVNDDVDWTDRTTRIEDFLGEIDAILPKTEEVKDE